MKEAVLAVQFGAAILVGAVAAIQLLSQVRRKRRRL